MNRNLTRTAPFLSLLLGAAAPVIAGDFPITINNTQSIQATINSGSFDEIILEPGNYNQVVDFGGAAIMLRSQDPQNPAVLDGSFWNVSVVTCSSGEGPDTVLQDLIIRNGLATDRGGGLWVDGASPTVTNCRFEDNEATIYGGGAIFLNSSSVVTGCTFSNNDADYGGGMYVGSGTNVTITSCHFELNSASINGGAIRSGGGVLSISDSTFEGNDSHSYGGALELSSSTTVIERAVFADNMSDGGEGSGIGRGGAIRTTGGSLVARNSVFTGNYSRMYGGCFYGGEFDIYSCTFAHNQADADFAVADSGPGRVIVNCLGWNNTSTNPVDAQPTVLYSMFGVDPLFVDADGADDVAGTLDDDLRLDAGSLAIDAGDAAEILGEYPTDFDGNARAVDDPDTGDTGVAVLGLALDMGAFEYQPGGGGFDPCPEDVDGDGSVNVVDLLAVLSAWGSCLP